MLFFKKKHFLHFARMYFGVLFLFYCINFLGFYAESEAVVMKVHAFFALICSLLVIIGFVNRIVYGILLLFCWFYIGNVTVEQALLNNLTFWFFVINVPGLKLDNGIKLLGFQGNPILLWLPVLNDACYHFLSSIQKFSDDAWIHGFGMFATFNLPWMAMLPLSVYTFLPETLQLFLNYGAMLLQALILPLMLFRYTSWVAILFIFIFYITLIYPARLDLIGQLGLVYCLFALSSNHNNGYKNFAYIFKK